MNWIKPVKKPFAGFSAFSVIEPDGNESKRSCDFPAESNCSGNYLVYPVITEEVEQFDQQDTTVTIVCVKEVCKQQCSKQRA